MFRTKRICACALVVFVFTFTAFAQTAGLPRFKKGESYSKVRVKMLKAGWKPFHAPNVGECASGDKRCQGRPEMESCAGTGLAQCRFLWKRKGKTTAISTVGENDAVYNGYDKNYN